MSFHPLPISALLFLLAGGCTVLRTEIGRPLHGEQIESSDSSTHYRDTLKALGPPTKMSRAGSDLVFLYEYTLLKEKQFGLNVDMNWIRLLKLSIGRAHAKHEAAVFIYDRTGTLRARSIRRWTEDLGSGNALQFLISVMNVVDTEAFEGEAVQHQWGSALLEPRLAIGLNRQSHMESGQQGLELLATPVGAGQHSLEQR